MLYEFECVDCHKHVDHLLKIAERDNPGPCDCGGTLRRVLTSPVIVIDGSDPDFPTAGDKWEKRREKIIAMEQKNLRDTGEYYPNPRHI